MMSQKNKQKRNQERSETAVKNSTSIRLSENERKVITGLADAKGMKLSEYVRDRALHGEDTLSPYQKMKIQNTLNAAYEVIKGSDPGKAQEMMREMKEIWTM